MAHASRLSLALAVLSFAGCAVDDESSPEHPTISTPRISAAEHLGSAPGFTAVGGGFAADSAAVTDGRIRVNSPAGAVDFATASVRRDGAIDAPLGATVRQPDGSLSLDRGAVTELLADRDDGLEQSWRFEAAPVGGGDLVVSVKATGYLDSTLSEAGLYFRTGEDSGVSYSHATWIDADGIRTPVAVAWTGSHISIRVPAATVDTAAYPAVLDPLISSEAGVEPAVAGFTGNRAREPSIALSNNRYLAVWRDDRSGFSSDIYAARINTDGSVHDLAGIRLTFTVARETTPKVVWVNNQGHWLVTWVVDEADIAAATVSPNGTVTQLGTVAGTAAAELNQDLAADGGIALMVYQSDGDVRALRYGLTGFGPAFDVAADPMLLEEAPTVSHSDGGDFLVSWESGDTGSDIRGQLVTRTGPLNGASFDISVDTGVQSAPASAWDGTNFLVTWKSGQFRIRGTRVSTAGVVLDVTGAVGGVDITVSTTIVTDPDVSCDSATCLFAWEDQTDTVNRFTGVFGQERALDFTEVGGVITINDAVRSQTNLAIAPRASGGHFVMFDDRAIGLHSASLVRISPAGTVQDATPILVNLTTLNSQRRPVLARSAVGQLLAWEDSRNFGNDIMALRYNAIGGKVDPSPGARVVSDAAFTQTTPAVDFDGTQYVVAWSDSRNDNFDIFAARFLDDGTNLDPAGIPITVALRNQTAPAVASGGGGSLVVWVDESEVPSTRADIVGAIVAPDGSFTSFDICRGADDQFNPEVAWDPTNNTFVVTWEDFRNGSHFNIFATRVLPDGSVPDGCGVTVSGAAGDQRSPEIATAGSQLLIVWEDYRSDPGGDIRGTRITAAGAIAVLTPAGTVIAGGTPDQVSPAVGGLDNGRWSIAYERRSNLAAQGSDIVGNEMLATGSLLGPQYPIAASSEWETGARFQSGVNNSNVTNLTYQLTKTGSSLVKVRRRRLTH
jgi:hypothetical protein